MPLPGALLLLRTLLPQEPTTQEAVPQTQGVPRETIVSAQKFDQPLADYPGSATVVDAEEIGAAGLLSVRDAARRVPNLYMSEFTSRRLSFPFIRGVGSGLGDPAVITYVDDVPQFGFGGTNLPLFEIDRVEFLRGPQGTLYGKNALGGLIHVHGARPTSDTELGGEVSYGSFDELSVSGRYSGPIPAGLGRFGYMDSQRDGYTKNDFTGNHVDDRHGQFGRATALFTPMEGSELQVSFFGERARDGGFALSFLEDSPLGVDGLRDNPHHINQDFEGDTLRDVLSPSVVWRSEGDEYAFTSISAYQRWVVEENTDFDFSPLDAVRRHTREDQDYFYQEFRVGTASGVQWPLSPWRDVTWQVGVSGFVSDSNRDSTNNFRPDIVILNPFNPIGKDRTQGAFEDEGVALFGQATVFFSEGFELTGGLRGDVEHKEVDRDRSGVLGVEQGSEDETFEELMPLVSLGYHIDAETLAYARVAQGYKAGGFNLLAPTPGQIEFDSETAWTYELGLRRTFPEQRASVAAAVFLVDWEDMQLSQFDPIAGGYVDNVGEAQSQGLELEGQTVLVENLSGFASLGWMSSEIEEFVDSFGNDTSGNELPQAPETTWSLGLEYGGELATITEGRWFVRGEYMDVGEFFYDAGNLDGDDYALVNFHAGVTAGRIGLSVWVRNAFDEEYVPIAFQPSPADPSTFVGENGAPRVIGLTLSAHL